MTCTCVYENDNLSCNSRRQMSLFSMVQTVARSMLICIGCQMSKSEFSIPECGSLVNFVGFILQTLDYFPRNSRGASSVWYVSNLHPKIGDGIGCNVSR